MARNDFKAMSRNDGNNDGVFDAPVAPLDNAHKFFIANVDFAHTAPQVKAFFGQLGHVNHVKLIPLHSDNHGNDHSHKHKGYGFLFMLDHASSVAVENYINAFPNNKIEMLGRRDVFVKRHDEGRRTGHGGGGRGSAAGALNEGQGGGGGGGHEQYGPGSYGPSKYGGGHGNGHGGYGGPSAYDQGSAPPYGAAYPGGGGGQPGFPAPQGSQGGGVANHGSQQSRERRMACTSKARAERTREP